MATLSILEFLTEFFLPGSPVFLMAFTVFVLFYALLFLEMIFEKAVFKLSEVRSSVSVRLNTQQFRKRQWERLKRSRKFFCPRHQSEQASKDVVSLKLLVETEKNRVVFAECQRDFVELLLELVSLPIGSVVLRADKSWGMGCMDELYKSVESLDEECFKTRTCRNMLLNRRSQHETRSSARKADNRTKHTKRCTCTNAFRSSGDGNSDAETEGPDTYIVSDDLRVFPLSISASFKLMSELRLGDEAIVEVRNIIVDTEEVLYLLKRGMISKTPLTDVFVSDPEDQEHLDNELVSEFLMIPNAQVKESLTSSKIVINIWRNRFSGAVLCAEASHDFVDLLLCFLTLPSSSIVRLLRGHASVGSICNLCQDTRLLQEYGYMENPPLGNSKSSTRSGYRFQNVGNDDDEYYEEYKTHYERINYSGTLQRPKLKLLGMAKAGGGFMRKSRQFMITDDLAIDLLSPVTAVYYLNKLNIPISILKRQSVSVGENEALALLKASLVTKSVLCQVFNSGV